MRAALGVLADVCCVLAFVVIGRANHHAGESLAGMTSTAWPFLVGLAIGEVATRAWRRPAALAPTGVGVWLATVVLGQLLRAVSGPGTDAAFIAVSAVFLGLFLIGWRLVAVRIPAVRSHPAGGDSGQR
ncbi:MAG TPA: DUF3054 domain-containing protein [Streptosporangiaceae bacterium]